MTARENPIQLCTSNVIGAMWKWENKMVKLVNMIYLWKAINGLINLHFTMAYWKFALLMEGLPGSHYIARRQNMHASASVPFNQLFIPGPTAHHRASAQLNACMLCVQTST